MCRLHRGLSVIWLCAISSTLFAPAKFTDKASGVVATGSATVKVIKQLTVKGGKVETSKNGTLEGTKVVYTAGKLIQENSTNIDITGEFNPDEDTVTLADQKFNASPGNIAQDVHLSGNSLLEGTPTAFASSTGVKIAGASSVLNLALTSPLGTNIGMNGGTVVLQGSTKLGDGKTPIGNGTLEFNKNSLSLGGTPVTLSGKLTLKKAADLIFNSKVTVTGQLTFDGDGQVSGNGNLMDISLGGTLAIRPNTTIYMTNLKLRGLGLGKVMFYDDTSQLYMSNVEIEMDRNYSVTIGGIYMEGPTNIVTKNNRLAFSLRGSLTVDGIALTYDTLTYTNQNNIVPLVANDPNHKFVTVLNDGVIRRLDNFDIISGNSSAIRYLTNLARTSSNAMLFSDKANSGAIGYLTAFARSSSGGIGYLTKFARANSGGVAYLTALARASSNAMLFSDKANSGAIGYLTAFARSSSGGIGYLTKFARANSGGVTYLTALARTSSNANVVTIRTTSNAMLFSDRANSGSVGYLTAFARSSSGGIGYLTKFARANSGGVAYLTVLARTSSNANVVTIRTTSNATLFSDRTNSGGIGYLTAFARSSSGAIGYLTKFARANSGGVMYLTTLARTSSNANVVTIRTTSNAMLFSDRTNSGGIGYLTAFARSSSGGIGYLTRFARANSGGVTYLTALARTSSNANVVTIRTTSNAMLFSDRTNSGSVVYLTGLARASSNASLYGNRGNSSGVVYLTGLARSSSGSIGYLTSLARATSGSVGYLTRFARANSGGVTYLTALARTSSNANVVAIRTTSNALLFGDRINSSAIINTNNNLTLAYGNSTALLYLNRISSATIVYWSKTNSNALIYGDRVTSNAVNYLSKTTSNSIYYLANTLQKNSNAINYLSSAVTQNSTAITYVNRIVRTTSQAVLYLNRTTSNSLLYGQRVTSSALQYQGRTNSAALVYGLRTLSNASLYGNRTNSAALLYWARTTSSALVKGLRVNSNALLYNSRTTSNSVLYGLRTMSNSLLYLVSTVSDTILYVMVTLENNSNAIANLDKNLRADSNAFAYGIANNSGAIVALSRTLPLVSATSNALLYLHKVDSDAIVRLDNGGSSLSRANSSALLYLHRVDSSAIVYAEQSGGSSLSRANSSALLYLNRVNSNTMLYGFNVLGAEVDVLNEAVRTHSNAFAYGITNNSSAIIKLNSGGGNALSLANSNALLYLHRVDSGAIVALASVSTDLIVQNSRAIVRLNRQAQTLYGPDPLIVTTASYVLSTDVYLSTDHVMFVQSGAGSCTIDGGGHTISFASAQTDLMQVDPGIVVTLTNVVLNNYSEAAVLLGSGSSVQFGTNVKVELASDQAVTRDWAFTGGNTMVAGNGNRLTFGTGSIVVRPSSLLRLQAVGVDGLKNSNLRCDDTSSSLVLEASDLYLTNNMSFSSGVLDIVQDVRVTGTNTFTFSSDQALLVESASALRLDGITFAYQPSTDNRDALVLADRSSVLAIDGCTLQSTMTGMRLTRGMLVVDSANKLVNTGAISLSEGFCFGNGNPDDDLAVQIKPGASLNLQTGGLIDYANVN